jgi:hypothetical protein
MAESAPTANGEWITPDVSYVDPQRIFCDLCGRPIARRFWRVTIDGEQHTFCDPEHADLFRTWAEPTYE